MGNVLAADLGVEEVAGSEEHPQLLTLFAVTHLHFAIQHHEDFAAVVDVPDIGLVGPVQAYRGAVEVGNVQRAPGPVCGEVAAAYHANGAHARPAAAATGTAGLGLRNTRTLPAITRARPNKAGSVHW